MASKSGNESLQSESAADADTNQSVNSKDKLMHSLFSAIEHLLPIDHKKANNAANNELSNTNKKSLNSNPGIIKGVDGDLHHASTNDPDVSVNTLQSTHSMINGETTSSGMTQHKSSSDSVTRSNSFLSSLNSILQSNGHVISTASPKIRNQNIKLDPAKRASIFSDSEVVLNRKRHESPLKDSSLKSIDFNHVSRSIDGLRDEDYDEEDDANSSEVGDIHEDLGPELEIKDEDLKATPVKNDDYIIYGGTLASSQKNLEPEKREKPHRVVSDVPKRSSPLAIPSLQYNESENNVNSNMKVSASGASETTGGARSKGFKCKRAGTITVAPMSLTKLKSRSRGASITKQDLLDSKNQSNSSTCIYNLDREKSNVSTSSKEDDNYSSSDDQEEVFSCALQKDILMQGKLYLSKDTIKFRSKIFGVKNDISFLIKDIVQLEKKFTAMLFPNGIVIKTVDRDYIFASFLNRDSVFEKIMKRWGDVIMTGIQENNKSNSDSDKFVEEKQSKSKNGERKSIQRNSVVSKSSDYDRRDSIKKGKGGSIKFKLPEIFDSQGDSLKLTSPVKQLIHGITVSDGSDDNDDDDEEEEEESYSSGGDTMTSDDEYEPASRKSKVSGYSDSSTAASASNSFGPSTGKPYAPDLEPYSKDVDVSDDVITNTTLGIVFKILSDKMDVILDKGGNYSISKIEKLYPYEDDDSKLKANEFKREYSFTKPLNSSLGPKETVCQVTDQLTEVDLSKWFVIQQKTLTPDVPSGKSFSVITNIIVYWSGETDVTIKSYTKVIWTGKSWIKGPVENGNTSGQKQAMQSLVKEVQELSDNYKPSQKTAVSRKKTYKSKSTKKTAESKKPTDLEHKEKTANVETIQQPATTDIFSFVSNVVQSKNISNYLMWAIVLYLLFDKFFHKQEVVIYNKFGSDSMQNSETDIWSWVLERTDGISDSDVFINNSSATDSFDKNSLNSFSKQELFGIKELKEKELRIIENMMTEK